MNRFFSFHNIFLYTQQDFPFHLLVVFCIMLNHNFIYGRTFYKNIIRRNKNDASQFYHDLRNS